ncbi:MAG: 6-phosphofructokinase [Chitinophagales bacterium]|nr:6-phosphofructokinase [Chitinophagales bacterium]MBP6153372.1 6-phosphofructokinase [Chitinophagales bacterium]
MISIKSIAILTSGGDAPGMNACIRAVVRSSIQHHIQVFGVFNGFDGLIDDNIKKLNSKNVGNIIQRGGTILKSSRSKRFITIEGRAVAFNNLKKNEIDALIVIGGDGTFKGASQFSKEYNLPIIGIPGTIDNDLYGTDYTIGFDSAVQTAVELIDKVRDTANALGRLFFIEVMGRDVGSIALQAGLAAGAEDILIPEIKTDLHELSEKLKSCKHKESIIVVVAEGDDAGGVIEIAAKFQKLHPEYDIKTLVLGHLLRGGNPTANDRILASRLGVAAVETLVNGYSNVMVGIKQNKITLTNLELCKKHYLTINQEWKKLMDLFSS